MSPGETAPADHAAEWSLIGCCILDPNWRSEAVEHLSVESFDSEPAALAFEAMRRTVGEPDDAFGHEAAAAGLTPAVWMELANSVPTATNFPFHLRKVREAWAARRLWGECHKTIEQLDSRQLWTDVTETAVQRVHDAVEVKRGPGSVHIGSAAEEFLRAQEEGTPRFYFTGFRDFDTGYGGLPHCGLVTIIGPSGHGKSTLALNMLTKVAEQTPVRLFSYEMPAEQIAASVLSMVSQQPVRNWSACNHMAVNKAHGTLLGLDFEVVDDLLDARQIFARCWRYKSQGVGVVAIDYLQNLPLLPDHESHWTSIVESAQLFQRIARQMGLCVVMVSQGDKEATKRGKPMGLGDSFGGIVVQQVTDLGLSVYRPGYVDPTIDINAAGLHVVKNKYGPVTSGNGVPLVFNGATATFREADQWD